MRNYLYIQKISKLVIIFSHFASHSIVSITINGDTQCCIDLANYSVFSFSFIWLYLSTSGVRRERAFRNQFLIIFLHNM